jgi:hypothetical protein
MGMPCSGIPFLQSISDVKFKSANSKLYYGSDWISWTAKFKELIPFGPPYYSYSEIAKLEKFDNSEKAEITRFMITLELWQTTPGLKLISAEEVFRRSMSEGSSYAKILEDQFALTWRSNDISSYNAFFPSRLLPRFEEFKNDLALAQEATFANEEALDDFECEARDLIMSLPDINLPSDAEILFERSTTTSYVHDLKREMAHCFAMDYQTHFEEKRLIGRRCIVPVFPGGVRDTVIADINCNCSIRWIERAMRHILQHVPESAVCLQSSLVQRRIDKVIDTYGYHVLRDLKKCGITYNTHDLFPIIQRLLVERYGDVRFNRLSIFSDFSVIDDDKEYPLKRGYGLGMANHTVTLCNVIIHRMAEKVLAGIAEHPYECRAIIGNDDEDVAFTFNEKYTFAEANAREYLSIEHDVHAQLGNIVNSEKSTVQPYALFYEQYSKPGWLNKEALACGPLAAAYLAPNIRVAKHYIQSQSDRFTNPWSQRALCALVEYWGGEFFDFRYELDVHYEVGGWLDIRTAGLKTTLRDIDTLMMKGVNIRDISTAYQSCKRFSTPPSPHWTKEEFVDNFLYQGASKNTDPRVQIYCLGPDDMRLYYKKLVSYQRRYDTRIRNFRYKCKARSIDWIQHDILKSEGRWYAIPLSLVKEESMWESQFEADVLSELMFHEERNIVHRLLYGEDPVPDISWDPYIDKDFTDFTINCEIERIALASQFSNTGVLPLIEFFYQFGEYPIVKSIIPRRNVPFFGYEWPNPPQFLSYDKKKGPREAEFFEEDIVLPHDIPADIDLEDDFHAAVAKAFSAQHHKAMDLAHKIAEAMDEGTLDPGFLDKFLNDQIEFTEPIIEEDSFALFGNDDDY